MGDVIVRLSNVWKSYGRKFALKGVNFELKEGQGKVIVGPNGSGKSTLIKIVLGLLNPNKGEVIRNFRYAGYVPESVSPMDIQYKVEDLIWDFETAFGAEVDGELMEKLEVDQLLGLRYSTLSKGEKKRVLLLLALSLSAPILVLDEPFAGLDFGTKMMVREVIAGRTYILVTHEFHAVPDDFTQLIVMLNGEVVDTSDRLPRLVESGTRPEGERVYPIGDGLWACLD